MIIDFRLRPPYKGFLAAGMYADEGAADFYARNIGLERSDSAKDHSMPMLFREMEDNGIDMGVVAGRSGHFKGSVPNADIVELVKRWPDHFIGLAGLNSGDSAHAIEEMEQYCVDGPLKGIVLEPGSLPRPLYIDDARLYPIYFAAAKYNLPVMVMLGGRAGPDRTYSDPMRISRIASDFPTVTFIAAHGGWPFVQEILGVCFYQENIYLCPDLYFFNLPGQDDYIRAAITYMKDRFLYGSAYPFVGLNAIHTFKKSFPKDIFEKIVCSNAKKILGLS